MACSLRDPSYTTLPPLLLAFAPTTTTVNQTQWELHTCCLPIQPNCTLSLYISAANYLTLVVTIMSYLIIVNCCRNRHYYYHYCCCCCRRHHLY